MNYQKAVGLLEEIKKELAEAGQTHPGERCEKGTHWNVKANKCLPLPPGLKGASHRAHAFTKALSNPSIRGHLDKDKAKMHSMAMQHHLQVAQGAKGAGFEKLAKHHKKIANFHDKEVGDDFDYALS